MNKTLLYYENQRNKVMSKINQLQKEIKIYELCQEAYKDNIEFYKYYTLQIKKLSKKWSRLQTRLILNAENIERLVKNVNT